jgi:hypothetical protein
MDIELKALIVFLVIFIICAYLAYLINLAFKKINKYFNDKRLKDFDNFVSDNKTDNKTTDEQLEELKIKYGVSDDFNFNSFPNFPAFPSSLQFYNIIVKRDNYTRRKKRIENCQAKYNHKIASNSKKIRGAGK